MKVFSGDEASYLHGLLLNFDCHYILVSSAIPFLFSSPRYCISLIASIANLSRQFFFLSSLYFRI
jgi:hypothetical protein